MFEANLGSTPDGIEVDIQNVDDLYAVYMPFITGGGLFLNRRRLDDAEYNLGDQVVVLLRLNAVEDQFRLEARVVWVTPSNPARGTGGIGVQFMDNGQAQAQIERMLTGMLQSERPTLTL